MCTYAHARAGPLWCYASDINVIACTAAGPGSLQAAVNTYAGSDQPLVVVLVSVYLDLVPAHPGPRSQDLG